MTGKELKEARDKLGLTQSELADKIGMSRVMIGLMERDVQPIEKRTELAVKCLIYDASSASSS